VAAKQFEAKFNTPIEREYSLMDLLRRPEVTYHELMQMDAVCGDAINPAVAEQIEIQAKYFGYIARQEKEIAKHKYCEEAEIPDQMDYHRVPSLSTEVRQKLEKIRPKTIGQASRISGVTPAAISLLLVHMEKFG
jgi:tRNA uridine 5-carboxymethylaminomethyl modification enzyme